MAAKRIVFGPVADPKGTWGWRWWRLRTKPAPARLGPNDPTIKSGVGFKFEICPMPRAVLRGPYLPQEVANVWRLWKAGIVRENYARADELGVVIVFEVDSTAAAKRYTDDFPLTKGGFIEWSFIPVQVPLPLEALFDPKVDVNEPYDRTTMATRVTR